MGFLYKRVLYWYKLFFIVFININNFKYYLVVIYLVFFDVWDIIFIFCMYAKLL